MSNRTQVKNRILDRYPELAQYFNNAYPSWQLSKATQPLVGVLRKGLSVFDLVVGNKQGDERAEAVEDAMYEITYDKKREKKIKQLQKELVNLGEKAQRAEENNPLSTLLKYGKFNELSKGLEISERGLDAISTIELTDDELAHLLQYYTLIYKDDYAYLKDNKTGELTLIPFNKWKLAFKRLFKLLKGFVGILVIGKYGYEIYHEWQNPKEKKFKNDNLEEYDDDIAQSSNVRNKRGGATTVRQPVNQIKKLTPEEKAEAEIRKWAARLGLGVSVLKNAKSLYDLYKWYKG